MSSRLKDAVLALATCHNVSDHMHTLKTQLSLSGSGRRSHRSPKMTVQSPIKHPRQTKSPSSGGQNRSASPLSAESARA